MGNHSVRRRIHFLLISLIVVTSWRGVFAETLNPEGVNPHAVAPKKRITQAQKDAAAEARKKKKAEIEARTIGIPQQGTHGSFTEKH